MKNSVPRNMQTSVVTCDESNAGVSIQIIITTDAHPWDISWELRKITSDLSTGDVLFSSPKDAYQNQYQQYKHISCVERNGCYKFIIHDSEGDGIDSDNGGFEVLLADNAVSTVGGDFGSNYESNLFGGEGSCPSTTPSSISAAPSLTSSSLTPSISAAPSLTLSKPPSLTPSISAAPSFAPSMSSVPSDVPNVVTCDEQYNGEVSIQIIITTDYYPDHTSWELRKITSDPSTGDVMISSP
jgi:hypothetical protein